MVEQRKDSPRTVVRLWGFIRPHQGGLFLSILFFILASATEPLVPALLKTVLDKGFSKQTSLPLWTIPAALIGLFALRGMLFFLGSYLLSWTTSRTVFDLRQALVGSITRADANLYTSMNPSVAVTKVIGDPQAVSSLLGGALMTVLRDGLASIAMLAYLLYIDWKLTLISLITAPFFVIAVKLLHRRNRTLSATVYDAQLRLAATVDDITRAWRVVRTFDAGEWERERFAREARHVQRLTVKGTAASSMMSPVSQFIASLGLATVLTLALIDARQDTTTVGDFVAFITAMLLLVSKARHLSDVSQPITNGLVVCQACFELMDTPEERDEGRLTIDSARGDIEFKDVGFSYPGSDAPALDGLNIAAKAGQTVALVGPSGSGKSTVISALLGFVHPGKGKIELDGIDIAELRKTSLRRQFAVVSQDIVLFDTSLADNVAYAQAKDEEKIEQCLKAANLWEFVSAQPEGMNMQVGTNGSRLSGGQRQRLAIARALYKDASVWIFDEATSALDSESERVVQQSIERWHGDKTLLLIAHRLSTVRRADRIYVLAQGRVAESGHHEELMARGGVYAGMVRAQAME